MYETSLTRRYKGALEKICGIFDDWNTEKIQVFLINSFSTDYDTEYSLNDLLATIRNIALAALEKHELVPGTESQKFPVSLAPEDDDYVYADDTEVEEPEGY